MNTTEAAEYLRISRQGVHVAYKGNKLKGTKVLKGDKEVLEFSQEDLENYKKIKYDPKYSMVDGKPKFDNEHGFYSPRQLAELVGCKPQRLYYLMNNHGLKRKKIGGSIIINIDDYHDLPEAVKHPS